MSQELLDAKAQDLAQALVQTYTTSYTQEFTTKDGKSIFVVVVSDKDRRGAIKKSIDESLRYIPIASGNPCPTCNGTGRI
jgi:hypothetical protein